MEYEQFVDEFSSELKQSIADENVDFDRHSVRKVNEELDGLSIKYPDSIMAPTIYLNDKYQMYQDGYSVKQLVDDTEKQLKDIRDDEPQLPEFTKESAKENLYCVVVNADSNEEMLRNTPHEKFEDLAVIPRFRVGEDASFIVSNEMCNHLQMTSEEVMEAAHKNTNKQEFPCQNLSDVMRDIMVSEGMPVDYVEEMLSAQGEDSPMYVLSNQSRMDGAVAITSEDAMDKAYQKVKADYPEMENMYVLGSSRHEVILVPDCAFDDVEDLKQVHQEVQNNDLSQEDKLTSHVYEYDGATREMTMVDSPDLKEAESEVLAVSESHGRSH